MILPSLRSPSLKPFCSLPNSQGECSILRGGADEIKLYQAQDLNTLSWPNNPEGNYVQKFFSPLMERGAQSYVENIKTNIFILVYGDLVLPITVNEAEYENSYVCSPYGYYFSYAKESLKFLNQAQLKSILKAILSGSSKIFKQFDINKVLIVNNWPFSTTLYPAMQPEQIKTIVDFLQERFPQHAILFRSIDPYTSPVCYKTLKEKGFDYKRSPTIRFISLSELSI